MSSNWSPETEHIPAYLDSIVMSDVFMKAFDILHQMHVWAASGIKDISLTVPLFL